MPSFVTFYPLNLEIRGKVRIFVPAIVLQDLISNIMHYTVLQQTLVRGAWYTSLAGTFSTFTSARRAVGNLISNLRMSDTNVAIRVLSPYEEDMVLRVGWISDKDSTSDCGQLVILKCKTLK